MEARVGMYTVQLGISSVQGIFQPKMIVKFSLGFFSIFQPNMISLSWEISDPTMKGNIHEIPKSVRCKK